MHVFEDNSDPAVISESQNSQKAIHDRISLGQVDKVPPQHGQYQSRRQGTMSQRKL